MVLWGKFNISDVNATILNGENYDYIQRIQSYKVSGTNQQISLFRVLDTQKKIMFSENVISIDPSVKKNFFDDLINSENTYIQTNRNSYRIYPFHTDDSNILISDNTVQLSIPDKNISPDTYKIKSNNENNSQVLVNVYLKKVSNSLIFSFYRQDIPNINSERNEIKIKELIISDIELKGIKLQIGKTTFNLPDNINNVNQYVGTTILPIGDNVVQLLQIASVNNIDLSLITATQPLNCYNDQLKDYAGSLNTSNGKLILESQNGSTCISVDLSRFLSKKTQYIDLFLQSQGTSQDLDSSYVINTSAKPALNSFIRSLEKPSILQSCLQEKGIKDCHNKNQIKDIEGDKTTIISSDRPIYGTDDLQLLLALKNLGYQKQALIIDNMKLVIYETIKTDTLNIVPLKIDFNISIAKSDSIDLSFPKPTTLESYYDNGEMNDFYYSNNPCDKADGYRTFRKSTNGLVGYLENCSNIMFQTLPFSSNNMYLWKVDYNLFSGKYPKFIVEDSFNKYLNDYLSVDQGYPDIPGFKLFQNPEWLTDPLDTQNKFNAMMPKTAFTYLYPQLELQDTKSKDITLHQDSENEAGFVVKSFQFVQLPNNWENLYIEPKNNISTYQKPKSYSYKQLLPSLYKIVFETEINDNIMLQFNEGYDSQWITFPKAISHDKCNSYTNCFEIKPSKIGENTLYIFYLPEILNFFGWGVTIFAIGLFFFIFTNRASKET